MSYIASGLNPFTGTKTDRGRVGASPARSGSSWDEDK